MNVSCQTNIATSGFAKGNVQQMTFGFPAHTPHEKRPLLEVNDYCLIFDLNGTLIAMSEGQIRTRLVVIRFGLKEFLSTCVKKFIMYIWSSAMKINC